MDTPGVCCKVSKNCICSQFNYLGVGGKIRAVSSIFSNLTVKPNKPRMQRIRLVHKWMTFFLFFALQLFEMSRRESCIKTTLAMYDNDLVRFFNNVRTLNFKAQPTNTVFRYRESNVRRLVLPSDCCRARGNQIKSLITVQTTWSEVWRSRRTFDWR